MQKWSKYDYTVEPFTEDYCGNLAWATWETSFFVAPHCTLANMDLATPK